MNYYCYTHLKIDISSVQFAHQFFESERVIRLWKRANPSHSSERFATWANCSQSLFCKEWREWVSQGRSFVMSNGSESLKLLFKKDWMSEERWVQFAPGKKGEKLTKKHTKNMNFLSDLLIFWERFSQSWANHSHRSFVKSNLSQLLTVTLL